MPLITGYIHKESQLLHLMKMVDIAQVVQAIPIALTKESTPGLSSQNFSLNMNLVRPRTVYLFWLTYSWLVGRMLIGASQVVLSIAWLLEYTAFTTIPLNENAQCMLTFVLAHFGKRLQSRSMLNMYHTNGKHGRTSSSKATVITIKNLICLSWEGFLTKMLMYSLVSVMLI